jgi:hypothetical protein
MVKEDRYACLSLLKGLPSGPGFKIGSLVDNKLYFSPVSNMGWLESSVSCLASIAFTELVGMLDGTTLYTKKKERHTQNIRNRGKFLDPKQYALSKIEEVLAVLLLPPLFLEKRLSSD